MNWRKLKSVELALWSIWIGSLWFMALLVAPGLFKWLARPEAGVAAGRLFYMLSWYSILTTVLLLICSVCRTQSENGLKLNILIGTVLLISVVEVLCLHPAVTHMRQTMTSTPPDLLPALKTRFGHLHSLSTVLYAVKMIAGLVWGLNRYTLKTDL